MQDRLVFLIGAPRSGTTLLARMLSAPSGREKLAERLPSNSHLTVRGHLPPELLTRPRQLAQRLNRRGRHEAAAHEPMGEQIGEPLRIAHIALAPGEIAHRRRVRQHQRQAVLEPVPHGFPVHARRLQHGMGAAGGHQPRLQGDEPGGGRRKRPHLVLRAPRRRHPHTRHHRLLVHVEPRAPGMADVHRRVLPFCRRDVPGSVNLPSVLRDRGVRGDNHECARDVGSTLVTGLRAPHTLRPRCRPPRRTSFPRRGSTPGVGGHF